MSEIRKKDTILTDLIYDWYSKHGHRLLRTPIDKIIDTYLAPEREASKAMYEASKSIENDDYSIPARIWNELQFAIKQHEEATE